MNYVCVTSSGLALVEMSQGSKPSTSVIQQKDKLQKEVEELLGTDGVLLYPSHPRVAPKHHHPLFRPFDFAYTGQSVLKLQHHSSVSLYKRQSSSLSIFYKLPLDFAGRNLDVTICLFTGSHHFYLVGFKMQNGCWRGHK